MTSPLLLQLCLSWDTVHPLDPGFAPEVQDYLSECKRAACPGQLLLQISGKRVQPHPPTESVPLTLGSTPERVDFFEKRSTA